MLALLITLLPGRRNEFIDYQKSKVCIAAIPIMDVKICWNFALELLGCAYRSWEFAHQWLQNPKYSEYRPLFTTQDEWTIVKCVIEVMRPFRYWTLWMSKRYPAALHHVIAGYNDTFYHMDGVM
jgi:hypothetical protein